MLVFSVQVTYHREIKAAVESFTELLIGIGRVCTGLGFTLPKTSLGIWVQVVSREPNTP